MLKRLKKWEEEHEDADLTQMEEAIDAELARMRRQILAQMAQESTQDREAKTLCPKCQQKMMKNGQKKRELRTKNGAKITIEREQMRCHQCGMTIFPP